MIHTRVGYTGGSSLSPTYRRMGDHTEALEVEYSPSTISFTELVAIFWSSHNPQARSYSRQYRAVLFTHDAVQARIAREYRDQLAEQANAPIFTEIVAAGVFYPAEGYHQKYRLRNNNKLFPEFTEIYPLEADFIRSTAAARVNGYLAGYGSLESLARDLPELGLSSAGQQYLFDRFKS